LLQSCLAENGACFGEIDAFDKECSALTNQENCEAHGVNAFSDGKCDWMPDVEKEVGYNSYFMATNCVCPGPRFSPKNPNGSCPPCADRLDAEESVANSIDLELDVGVADVEKEVGYLGYFMATNCVCPGNTFVRKNANGSCPSCADAEESVAAEDTEMNVGTAIGEPASQSHVMWNFYSGIAFGIAAALAVYNFGLRKDPASMALLNDMEI